MRRNLIKDFAFDFRNQLPIFGNTGISQGVLGLPPGLNRIVGFGVDLAK